MSKERLSKRQRFTRRVVAPVAILAMAGGVVAHETSGGAEKPKQAQVVLGSLALNQGVVLHNSPSQDLSDEGFSMNQAKTVEKGETIVVEDPILVEKKDGLGNTTTWYGFTLLKNGGQLWFDATDISKQSPPQGDPEYINASHYDDGSYFLVSEPSVTNEVTARLDGDLYRYRGHDVAVGVEVPATAARDFDIK